MQITLLVVRVECMLCLWAWRFEFAGLGFWGAGWCAVDWFGWLFRRLLCWFGVCCMCLLDFVVAGCLNLSFGWVSYNLFFVGLYDPRDCSFGFYAVFSRFLGRIF